MSTACSRSLARGRWARAAETPDFVSLTVWEGSWRNNMVLPDAEESSRPASGGFLGR